MPIEISKSELINKITNPEAYFNNESAYQDRTLRWQEIEEIPIEKSKKYGSFRIRLQSKEHYYSTILADKFITEEISTDINGNWQEIISHSIYSYEKDFEHGKERNQLNAPIYRFIFVDIEYSLFYIENMEGMLYCSSDKINWYLHLVPYNKRPYCQRLSFLRKFPIVYEE
ncbi:MAG: hypothetical protein ACFFDW_14455 [Candidatus Thorarchaeota archaeon]